MDLIRPVITANVPPPLRRASPFHECLGMKQSALSRLESGQIVPTLRTLQRVARRLGKKLVITFQ